MFHQGIQNHALFITPVMPTLQGRGPGFRAYQWVNYLVQRYEFVTVICSSVYGDYEFIPEEFLEHPRVQIHTFLQRKGYFRRFLNVLTLKPNTYNSVNNEFESWFLGLDICTPNFILGFKITSYPVVEWLKSIFGKAQTAIDIDEVNSLRVWSIANLMKKNGLYGSSYKLIPEIVGYRMLESVILNDIDSVIVSTQKERRLFEKISAFRPCKVFENRFPLKKPAEAMKDEIFQFLFVGNSIHYPNRDAIETILFEILPQIKRGAANKFKIVIVGGVPNDSLEKKTSPFQRD